MPARYWLFKSEPSSYSLDDLIRDGVAEWDGVRNYQARNSLRDDVKAGDGVLFYHSSTDPIAVVGTATVMRGGYPDHTAWDPRSKHPDPKSSPDNPIWYMVDLRAAERFRNPVTMDTLRANAAVSDMLVLRRGMRLSIQPVTTAQWKVVRAMGRPQAV
ncbi:MAG: EVE domain-containing protein [Dehalococcoidia bacterium]|nr:EVE domain-containing protein [Dehalococcoidia bacterium]